MDYLGFTNMTYGPEYEKAFFDMYDPELKDSSGGSDGVSTSQTTATGNTPGPAVKKGFPWWIIIVGAIIGRMSQ